MPDRYRIIYTLRAASHLKDIFDYIEHDSPQNARKMIKRLLSAIESLDFLPRRYKVIKNVPELGGEIRSMPVPPYLIRYHVDDTNLAVTIVSVRHGARRPGI